MNKLINKTFSGIYRIVLHEDKNKYELEDSIVLKGSETYQLITNQENLEILKINDNFHIDGEYDYDKIELLPIVNATINISKIILVFDEKINQSIAFTIKSSINEYFFIRLSDEINLKLTKISMIRYLKKI
ncbi:hypothetical protein [Chryseobacterium indoltheticum]|uniref:hypothetical protein n=1 Tax=Chryseobacterium indoltheticum TaxID=254 RepID=UPI003F499B33